MSLTHWAVLISILVVALYFTLLYNRLIKLRTAVAESFSGITVQLRRRADLIPNLVSVVKGYASHEEAVIEQVSVQRSDALSRRGVEAVGNADAKLSGLLGRLIAVAEAYPDLKANSNFLELQDELEQVESDLQSARRFYNANVRNSNASIQSFPQRLVARPLSLSPQKYYQDQDPQIQYLSKVSLADLKA